MKVYTNVKSGDGFIPSFKPAKTFVEKVKTNVK